MLRNRPNHVTTPTGGARKEVLPGREDELYVKKKKESGIHTARATNGGPSLQHARYGPSRAAATVLGAVGGWEDTLRQLELNSPASTKSESGNQVMSPLIVGNSVTPSTFSKVNQLCSKKSKG